VALSAKPASGEELESERLKTKFGAALIERDRLLFAAPVEFDVLPALRAGDYMRSPRSPGR
jgi:hypothetical protein